MTTWLRMLKGDPLPWLLEEDTPAVRHLGADPWMSIPPRNQLLKGVRRLG